MATRENEGLVLGAFAFQLLCQGHLTLPAVPTPAERYRIVIAEYEEYLVDGTFPYSKTPDNKDRRLIFVENVEITYRRECKTTSDVCLTKY